MDKKDKKGVNLVAAKAFVLIETVVGFLSPSVFLRQGAREIMAKEDLPLLPPVPCGAMTVIGVSTLPQER